MLKNYIIARPFGPYQKGDMVQFSPEDAERFKAYLAGSDKPAADNKPEAKLEENKKAPKASKK